MQISRNRYINLYMDPMGYDSAFNDFSDHYPERLKHDPNLTGADAFEIGWAEQKHQLLRFPLHVFTGVSKTIAKKRIYGIGRFSYICHKDQVDIGKYTALKWNIAYIATQNDAMFEFGDTSSKPSFFGIYISFRGCTSSYWFHAIEKERPMPLTRWIFLGILP